jgi:purine-nucleoside phosphorylase
MSTVNEVSLAVTLGMRVAGISCITNLATGISKEKLSHAEVTEVANMVKKDFTALLQSVLKAIKN